MHHVSMPDERMAQVEEIRLRIGVSRPTWAELLGTSDPDAALARAKELDRDHRTFKRRVVNALDIEFARPTLVLDDVKYITTRQATRALGLGEFHLSNLRDRQRVEYRRVGRRTLYSRSALDDLINMTIAPRAQHAPLSTAFVAFLEERRSA